MAPATDCATGVCCDATVYWKTLVLLLVAASFVGSCSARMSYEATASELSEIPRRPRQNGLVQDWRPLGEPYSYRLSSEERIRARFFLVSCADELEARFSSPPGRALRAVQIGECMQARGWHLAFDEGSRRRD